MSDGGRASKGRAVASPGDLLAAAGRERTVLASGFLAGLCVFFAPLAVLGFGLLAAHLASYAGDGVASFLVPPRPLERSDFRSVFAPAVTEAPLLVTAGLVGALVAQIRRWLARQTDPVNLRHGRYPVLREYMLLYALLCGLVIALAATRGGWPQVERLLHAAPAFLFLMLGATWLARAVWSYCFGNIIELLASRPERDAAAALGGPGRRLGPRGSHA